MKNKTIPRKNVCLAIVALGSALAMSACTAHVSGGGDSPLIPNLAASNGQTPAPTPTPNPSQSPVPFPSSCTNYSGTYQMNTQYFQIAQTGCSDVTFTFQSFDSNVAPTVVDYIPDAVTRLYSAESSAASWIGSNFVLSSTDDDSDQIVERFSFQTAPCNLMNPDGTVYLTSEAWFNGIYDQDSCQFWAPVNLTPTPAHTAAK